MSCASGGAVQGSSAIASVFQSCATTGRSPRASANAGERLRLRHEHLVAGVGGDGQRPGTASKSSVPGRRGRAALLAARARRPRRRRLELVLRVGGGGAGSSSRRPAAARQRPPARRRARRARPRSAPRGTATTSSCARGAARPRRAPPRAARAGRAARTRGRPRAGASGRARARRTRRRSMSELDRRADAVASCFEIRASSAWSVRFSLRLAPGDLVDVRQHALEVAVLLEQLRGGLVADARHAGDVVGGVALQPEKSGTSSGGMP